MGGSSGASIRSGTKKFARSVAARVTIGGSEVFFRKKRKEAQAEEDRIKQEQIADEARINRNTVTIASLKAASRNLLGETGVNLESFQLEGNDPRGGQFNKLLGTARARQGSIRKRRTQPGQAQTRVAPRTALGRLF